MNIIAQEARFRQRVVKYAKNRGVTRAANTYKVSRQSVYRWLKRYDGTLKSLVEKSHKPKKCYTARKRV